MLPPSSMSSLSPPLNCSACTVTRAWIKIQCLWCTTPTLLVTPQVNTTRVRKSRLTMTLTTGRKMLRMPCRWLCVAKPGCAITTRNRCMFVSPAGVGMVVLRINPKRVPMLMVRGACSHQGKGKDQKARNGMSNTIIISMIKCKEGGVHVQSSI